MRILVIDAGPLDPTRDAGSRRMLDIMASLKALGHGVVLVDATQELPTADFDTVILSRVAVASRWLDSVRKRWPAAAVIFDTVDLHHVREFRAAKIHGNIPLLRQALVTKRQELAACAAVDQIWVVTDVERDALRREGVTRPIAVVSMAAEASLSIPPWGTRTGAVFVANFQHQPNLDAFRYYLKEIAPRLPSITLHVAGSHMPEEVWSAKAPCIQLHGWLPDLNPLYDSVRVAVAPLRFGAGIKGKVLEALGRGVPVVGTPIAWEGLASGALMETCAADAEAFARAVLRVHDDSSLWTRVSESARTFVRDQFGLRHLSNQLAGAINTLCPHTP